MSYHVHIHTDAERDFNEQFDYIAARSLEGALRWEDAFDALKTRLSNNPFQYGSALEAPWLRRELLSAPFRTQQGNTYVAVYIVAGAEVTILRVRGQGQDLLGDDDLPNG